MMKRIPKKFRNCGESHGLEYHHICGRIDGRFLVWDRRTGEIVYEAQPKPGLWDGLALIEVRKECERLNALQIGITTGKLPTDFAAIDSTP